MDNQTTINLIEKLGWSNLLLRDQEYLVERTGGLIFQKIMAQLLHNLTDSEQDELDKLLSEESVDTEKLTSFIKEKIPNSDEIIQKEVEEFLKETDDIMGAI